ncbi:MAG: cell envelope integrity protein TolA, partial [Flavobacterium sp.]
MQKIILYISIALLTIVNSVVAQEKTFEQKAKEIAVQIKTITEEEKRALKAEVEALDKAVELGKMTKEEAATSKAKIAEERAKNIETKIAAQEKALRDLVNGNVNEEESNDSLKKNSFTIVDGSFRSKNYDKNKSENRTTSQAVFAGGYNNLVTDGAVANSQFGYGRSGFYEWGVTWNTRLSNNSNLLHLKYGVGFMYNQLHATDNRVFADINNQTVLVDAGVETKAKRTYFKNVYFVVPMHLEFDFSKTKIVDDKKVFKSHTGARFGIGGFVGVNTNSKQFIEYEQNGYKFKEKQKGDFNVNDFTYGVSTYIGYKATSLYLKYDLNP